MTTLLELLAPAGDADIGIAAINHGADAVYIGAPRFSARAQAGVSLTDIARLIQHAHFYRARVYVALNTILTDAELAESLDMIREIYTLGADGLILQDVGLLELDLPPISLIASTQMDNSTPAKIRFLEDVGFQRAILARELSLTEISEIRRKTSKIDLEAFVHGALCVSYSGQCYMSQAVAGRSGNRGVCAQPCRSYYTLTDGDDNILAQDKHLLSLKDMNRITAIPDLIAAGVTSFKIEGRYKGIEYVKNVTAAYRLAIDRFIDKHPEYGHASAGSSAFTFTPDVDRTFNRGYTSYFLSGKQEKIASIDTQKAIGQQVGKITSLEKDYFKLENHDLQNGDGLCFFTGQNELAGFRINRVEQGKIYPSSMKDLAIGTFLFRNHDIAFEKMLKKSSGDRRIAVEMFFTQEATGIRLSATDEDGSTVESARCASFDPSHHPEKAKEHIKKQLTSTGNTLYRVAKLTIHPEQPGFLPASTLNSIRREVLDKLTFLREDHYVRREIPFTPNNVPCPQAAIDYRANVMNAKAGEFYKRHGATIAEPAFETLSDITGKTVMTTRYCIRYQLELCPKMKKSMQNSNAPLRLQDARHTYRLTFDCEKCRMLVILEA